MAYFQNEKVDVLANYLKKPDSSKIETNETFINLSSDFMKASDFVTSGSLIYQVMIISHLFLTLNFMQKGTQIVGARHRINVWTVIRLMNINK